MSSSDVAFVVYCHTNVYTGKSYVGWTSKTMEQRWEKHVKDASRGSAYYFHRSISKHGVDCWTHQVLECCSSQDGAKLTEMKWIAQLRSNEVEYGYNGTSGGDGTSNPSLEVRQRMSAAAVGKKKSEMTRLKMKRYALNRPNEHNEKVTAAFRKWISEHPEHREKIGRLHAKPITQLTLANVFVASFESVSLAAKTLGYNASCIAAVARGNRNHHQGYKWSYEQREDNNAQKNL